MTNIGYEGPYDCGLVFLVFVLYYITCSAMILDADWSIGVRSGADHPLADSIPHGRIQYHHL